MKKYFLSFLIIFSLIAVKAQALDTYSIYGPKDCSEFSKLTPDIQYSWIMGIFTGYNVGKGFDIKDRDFRMDKYLIELIRKICQDHPELSPEIIVGIQIDKWVEEDNK